MVRGEIPADIQRDMELWTGCIAGALEEKEYVRKLEAAGFEEAGIEPTRIYKAEDAREFLKEKKIDLSENCGSGGREVHERVCEGKEAAPVVRSTAARTLGVQRGRILPQGALAPEIRQR